MWDWAVYRGGRQGSAGVTPWPFRVENHSMLLSRPWHHGCISPKPGQCVNRDLAALWPCHITPHCTDRAGCFYFPRLYVGTGVVIFPSGSVPGPVHSPSAIDCLWLMACFELAISWYCSTANQFAVRGEGFLTASVCCARVLMSSLLETRLATERQLVNSARWFFFFKFRIQTRCFLYLIIGHFT